MAKEVDSRRAPREGGRSRGQKVVVVFGCANPVGFWAWAEDWVSGRGLGMGGVIIVFETEYELHRGIGVLGQKSDENNL